MSKAKFTSGPWSRIVFRNGEPGFKVIAGKKPWTEQVAEATEIYMDRGQRHANARLIACAPEMYDVLAAILEENPSPLQIRQKAHELKQRIDGNSSAILIEPSTINNESVLIASEVKIEIK